MSRQLRSNMNAADKAELDSNFRRITNAPPVNQSALIAALPLSTSSSPVDFIPDSSGFRPIVPQTAITFYDVANPSLIPRHPSSNADPKSRAQSPSGEPNPTEKRFNFLTDSISTVRSDIFKEKARNDSRFETIERWRQGHEATTIAQQQNLVKSFERQQAEEIENSKLQRDLDAQEHARQHDLQTDLEAQRQARQTDLDAQRQARQTELYDRRLAQLSNFFREELQVLRVDINEIKDVIKDVVDYRISHENVHNANAATLKLIDIDSMREDITSNTNAILEHRKSLAHLQQETQDVHTFMTARLQPQDGSDTSYFSANDDTPFKSLKPVKSVTSIPILQSDLPDPPRQIPSVSIHPSALESHFDASINYPNHSTQQLRHMRAIAKVFDEDSNLSDFRSFYLQSQPHLQKSRLDYLPFFDTNSDIGTHSIFNTSRQSQPQPPIGTTDPVSLYSRLSILEKLLLPLPPTESVIYHDYDYEPFYMFFDRFDTLNKNKNAKEDNELLQYLKLSNATNPKNFKAMEATGDYSRFMVGVFTTSINPEFVLTYKHQYFRMRAETANNMNALVSTRNKALTLIHNNNKTLYTFITNQVTNIIGVIISRLDDPTWNNLDQSVLRKMSTELRQLIAISDLFLMTALELGCSVELSWNSHALPFLIRNNYHKTPHMDGVKSFSIFMYDISEMTGAMINFPIIEPTTFLFCLYNLSNAAFPRDNSFRPRVSTRAILFPKVPFGHHILRMMTRNINLFYLIISAITPAKFANINSYEEFQDLATLIGHVMDTHIKQLLKTRSLLDNTKVSTSATQLPESDVLSLFNPALGHFEVIARLDPRVKDFHCCLDIAFDRDNNFVLAEVLKNSKQTQLLNRPRPTPRPTIQHPATTITQPTNQPTQFPASQSQVSVPQPISRQVLSNGTIPINPYLVLPNPSHTTARPPAPANHQVNTSPPSNNHNYYGRSPEANTSQFATSRTQTPRPPNWNSQTFSPSRPPNQGPSQPPPRQALSSQPVTVNPTQRLGHIDFSRVPRSGAPNNPVTVHVLTEATVTNDDAIDFSSALNQSFSPLNSEFHDLNIYSDDDNYRQQYIQDMYSISQYPADKTLNPTSISDPCLQNIEEFAPESYAPYEQGDAISYADDLTNDPNYNAAMNLQNLHSPCYETDYLSSESDHIPIFMLGDAFSYTQTPKLTANLSVNIISSTLKSRTINMDFPTIFSVDTCCGKDVLSPKNAIFEIYPTLGKMIFEIPKVRMTTASGEEIFASKAISLTFTTPEFTAMGSTTLSFLILPSLVPVNTVLLGLASAGSTGFLRVMFTSGIINNPKVAQQLQILESAANAHLSSSSILMISDIDNQYPSQLTLQAREILQGNDNIIDLCKNNKYKQIYLCNETRTDTISYTSFYTQKSDYVTSSGVSAGHGLFCKIDSSNGQFFYGYGRGILISIAECRHLISIGSGQYMVKSICKNLVHNYNDLQEFSLASYANSPHGLVHKDTGAAAVQNTFLRVGAEPYMLLCDILADHEFFVCYNTDVNLVDGQQVFESSPLSPPSILPPPSPTSSDYKPKSHSSVLSINSPLKVNNTLDKYFTRSSISTRPIVRAITTSTSSDPIHITIDLVSPTQSDDDLALSDSFSQLPVHPSPIDTIIESDSSPDSSILSYPDINDRPFPSHIRINHASHLSNTAYSLGRSKFTHNSTSSPRSYPLSSTTVGLNSPLLNTLKSTQRYPSLPVQFSQAYNTKLFLSPTIDDIDDITIPTVTPHLTPAPTSQLFLSPFSAPIPLGQSHSPNHDFTSSPLINNTEPIERTTPAIDPNFRPTPNPHGDSRHRLYGESSTPIDPLSPEPTLTLCSICSQSKTILIHNRFCIGCFKSDIIGLQPSSHLTHQQLSPFLEYVNPKDILPNYFASDLRDGKTLMSFIDFKFWFESIYPANYFICQLMYSHAQERFDHYNHQCALSIQDLHRVHGHIVEYQTFYSTLGPEDRTSTTPTATEIRELAFYDNYQEKPISDENYATISKLFHLFHRLPYRDQDFPRSANPQVSHFCYYIGTRSKPWKGMFNDILFFSRIHKAITDRERTQLHVDSIVSRLSRDLEYEKTRKNVGYTIETALNPKEMLDNTLVYFLCRRYHDILHNKESITPKPLFHIPSHPTSIPDSTTLTPSNDSIHTTNATIPTLDDTIIPQPSLDPPDLNYIPIDTIWMLHALDDASPTISSADPVAPSGAPSAQLIV